MLLIPLNLFFSGPIELPNLKAAGEAASLQQQLSKP